MNLKYNVLFLLLVYVFFSVSCNPRFTANPNRVNKKITKTQAFENHFAGLVVYNPQTKDTLLNTNGNRYFTPASNTKIFTFYTALKMIPEYLETIRYTKEGNQVIVSGTGDPTPLHPYFKDSTLTNFIQNQDSVSILANQFRSEAYAPGWAWEDFDSYYSPERSALPLYGNTLSVESIEGTMTYVPEYFTANSKVTAFPLNFKRDRYENNFYIPLSHNDTIRVPFITSDSLSVKLLATELHKQIPLVERDSIELEQIVFGVARDSVLKRMMLVSDNFLAEQLLINAGSTRLNEMNSKLVRNYVLDSLLPDLKQRPRWVDGSGLSRYNLFSPLSMVQVLEKIYHELPKEKLFTYFPTGGVNGTIENWFASDNRPYVFAKTGTLGNNYSLSGYLLTDKGTLLIFSFMNNHYTQPTATIKKQMEEVLVAVKEKY